MARFDLLQSAEASWANEHWASSASAGQLAPVCHSTVTVRGKHSTKSTVISSPLCNLLHLPKMCHATDVKAP